MPSLDDLAECALAAGATQLGEDPHPHFILDLDQLATFARLVAAPALPPPPY